MNPVAEPEVPDLLPRLVEKSLVVYEEDERGRTALTLWPFEERRGVP